MNVLRRRHRPYFTSGLAKVHNQSDLLRSILLLILAFGSAGAGYRVAPLSLPTVPFSGLRGKRVVIEMLNKLEQVATSGI